MKHELPPLPYPRAALEPYISAETFEYHYGKHHQAYVDNLNRLIAGTAFEDATLEEIVRKSEGPLFNNAAQVWNHSFYWQCLCPPGGRVPPAGLVEAFERGFGSLDEFRQRFTQAAVGQFGSGWAWLVKKPDGNLAITTTANAATPLTTADRPLLTCDVWEHAYYIDYRNARPKYVESYWKVVNWDFVARNLG
ncbi:MAG: superoxide dismutase [Fe] [Acidobacteria bacterium]|nr:superoxide dismutase [Fe] [Acidobacteriota bacterium]